MPLQDESILHLSQLTASKAPAPGGGAICAMVGAFAAALAAMVAHLTKDKKGYEAVSADMETLIQQADDLQSLLLGDMDRDAASFTDYMQALKLPKETQQQKDERQQALQTALKKATLVPLETGKHIALVFPLARLAVMKGNTTAVTDGLSAAMLARSALRGVLLNVKINLQSIEDEAFVCATAEACRQLESYAEEAEKEALALQPKLQYHLSGRINMEYKSDIEIAQSTPMLPIVDIAASLGIPQEYIEQYGPYKAKISPDYTKGLSRPNGKLILVTAITPTPAGEGKTTTTVGLADGLRRIGKKAVVALREPSLGPVFGVKGGAAGGGYAQVVPMEDINLHFTGDFHAIGAANNLLAAMLDNHIQQGNTLGIDPKSITWKRAVDMNDRQLRFIVDGLGGKANGVPREDGFDITVASEVMAVLCLADGILDLKERLSRIVVGYTYGGKPITAGDLKAAGAMAALLKDALKPNLVQTLEHTPALVHGGPFANIAHGCNSVTATKLALKLGDYCVTEAGFGADLGAEKFFDIKCRMAGLVPDAVVVVATIRALKHHGGAQKAELGQENLEALEKGLPNLLRHVGNIKTTFGLPAVVAINQFPQDTEAEIALLRHRCQELGVNVVLSQVWEKGGQGGMDLAQEVVRLCEMPSNFHFAYESCESILEKMEHIVQRVYGGDGVELTPGAKKQLSRLEELGFGSLPVCMAKTQYSFSDDPGKLGAPTGFTVQVRNLKVSAGAGFIVALTGEIMTMPGLPKVPAAERIDVDENGKISGLF